MLGPFYISHEGGNCHSFVASLLLHLITDDPDIIEFSKRGHSHNYTHSFIREEPLRSKEEPALPYITVESSPAKIVYRDIPNIEELFLNNPHTKVIIIYVKQSEELRVEYNHYYKAYHGFPEKIIYYWDVYKKRNIPGIRKNLNKFNEFFPEEMKLLLEFVTRDKKRNREVELQYWKQLAEKFPNNLFILPFADIVTFKEDTLKLISKLVGKPITEELRQSYKNYVALQDELVEKYMFYIPK